MKLRKNKRASIIGGFTIDFWAIVAIFIILGLYVSFSFIINSLRGGGKIEIDNQPEESKVLNSLIKIDNYLDIFYSYENEFRTEKRDILFVIASFSGQADSLSNQNSGVYIDFFSNLKKITYFEMSKNNKYIYCNFGICSYGPPNNKREIEKLKDYIFEFYILDVKIIISDLDFVKILKEKPISDPLVNNQLGEETYLGGDYD